MDSVLAQEFLIRPKPVTDDPGRNFGPIGAVDSERNHLVDQSLGSLINCQLELDGTDAVSSSHFGHGPRGRGFQKPFHILTGFHLASN